MFIELIATIVAGIACAGVVMIVNSLSGRRMARWVVPVVAGLGMVAMTISNEYSWFDRTAEKLPEGFEVAITVEDQSWLRPWTRLWPYTKRFAAVDTATARRHQSLPDQRLATLYFFGRWSPVNKAPMLFDCGQERSAVLIDGAEFEADGTVKDVTWQRMSADDPVLGIVCSS